MRTRAWLAAVLMIGAAACGGEGGGLVADSDGASDQASAEAVEVNPSDTTPDVVQAQDEAEATDVRLEGEGEVPAEIGEPPAEIAELPPEVVEVVDAIGEDSGLEVVTPGPLAVRVATLSLVSPALCYPAGQTCVPLNGMVDAALQAALDDPLAPLDLLGVFGEAAGGVSLFAFGAAICTQPDPGVPVCGPDPDREQAHLQAVYLDPGLCPTEGADLCFQAGPGDVLLDLPLFGGAFGLRQAVIVGALQGDPTLSVEPGSIRGFLPRALASKYQIGGVGAEPVLVSDVFPGEVDHVEGQPGWWVTLGFTAARVEYAQQ